MKNNDFPTNPVAFAQYVWENIEIKDILVDRFHNFWKVTSYKICNGRKIRIEIRCISDSGTDYKNGGCKKLTRYDLASKYYFYINNIAVEIPDVEDWNAGTFVQNYNTLWYILDTMVPITKEETSDMYALFLLTQEADKIYQERNEKIFTTKALDELKNKLEKRDYDGDKIREKCENCLPKEDKKMTENEKNYFPKNKEKTGVDTQLKSAFYSQEELDEAIKKIDDFIETHTNTVKNKYKDSVKKFTGFSDEDLDEICTRVVDTFYSASDFSKKTFDEFKGWMKEKYEDYTKEVKEEPKTKKEEPKTETVKVNNNQSVVTVDNNDMGTEKPKPVFKLGDVVYTKGESVGYISRIGYTDRYCYYYWTPIIISSNDKTLKDEERGLTYPYETHYKRIGNYLMSDLNCVKEMARIDSVYKLNEDNLKQFPYLDKYINNFKDNEKDNNTPTTDSATPSSNRKTGSTDSLPNYLSKINLTDSAYIYERNTRLVHANTLKLNDIIDSLNNIIHYLQEEERRKQLEER